jgi:hypothetical protein
MTIREFRLGFLRVASRLKSGGERRSNIYGRRFTGAKGIGRLAAHKLASDLRVDSRSAFTPARHGTSARVAAGRVQASIDWDEVERHQTVEDVGEAIKLAGGKATAGDQPGTTIRLSSLRRRWSDRERTRFVREVSTFQPGEALCEAIAPRLRRADPAVRAPAHARLEIRPGVRRHARWNAVAGRNDRRCQCPGSSLSPSSCWLSRARGRGSSTQGPSKRSTRCSSGSHSCSARASSVLDDSRAGSRTATEAAIDPQNGHSSRSP